jgi:CSLREA domain-containing protein
MARHALAERLRRSVIRGVCALTLGCIGLLSAPLSAGAVDIPVTTTDDVVASDGQCSLREAIQAANADSPSHGCPAGSGTDAILLGPGHFTLTLSGPAENFDSLGDLDITSPLSITGAGTGSTIIDASGFMPAQPDRAIEVRPGGDVVLRALTVSGGHAPDGASAAPVVGIQGNPGETKIGVSGGAGGDGGGILNRATLTLENMDVKANHAGDGGAGGDASGGSGNGCACDAGSGFGGLGGDGGNGGGVANLGTLTVRTSTIEGNLAGTGGHGGGGFGGAGGVVGNNVGRGGDGNGGAPGAGGSGGGIFNEGTLTVQGSSMLGNNAGDAGSGNSGFGGAGGTSSGGVFHGADGTGHGSSGGDGGFGGGISDSLSVVVPGTSISDSTLAGNGSGSGGAGGTGWGGGPGGNSFAGNGGDSGYGGALLFLDNGDKLSNSTITGNVTGVGGAQGSAIITTSGTATNADDGIGRDGFALASVSAGAVLLHDTIFGNGLPPGVPEPIGMGHTTVFLIAGSTTISNSIIAGECAVNGASPLNDGGHNLAAGAVGCPGSSGDPKLAALADNGGPTPTMALAPGSAAIDKVPATGASCPPADQRGVARPQFAACDIGAFELAPVPPAGGDTVAPKVSHVSVSPRTFAVGPKATPQTSKRRRRARGTRIAFQVSEVAQMKLSFQRRLAGIKLRNRSGKVRCVAATRRSKRTLLAQVKSRLGAKAGGPGAAARIKRALRHARCARFATRGALGRSAKVGANTVAFSGRVGRKALRPGAYRVRVTGSDAAGNRSRPAAAAFRVVAR